MTRPQCRYCHRLPLGACGCCCGEHDVAPIRVRRFMDMDAYDPSPSPVIRRTA